MLIAGIDEAGRGPVIGPMVICGVVIEEKREHKLKELKVRDSKLISPKERERLFKEIVKTVKDYYAVLIYPKEIDDSIKSEKSNLNWLEAAKTAEIINFLHPDKAILDCPSPNIPAYKNRILETILDKNVKIIAEHKADVNYPVVSAASILAKVIRDREIEKIKKEINENFGSGYPADPLTKAFLEKNYDNEDYAIYFRKEWGPLKELLKKKNQMNLNNF